MRLNHWVQALLVLIFILTQQACAALKFQDVKPWKRGILAKDDMQLVSDTMEKYVTVSITIDRPERFRLR